jgi:hypothetical protein
MRRVAQPNGSMAMRAAGYRRSGKASDRIPARVDTHSVPRSSRDTRKQILSNPITVAGLIEVVGQSRKVFNLDN